MQDRRQGERRGEERREFRREEGRRDPERPRRRGAARYVVPALLLAIPVVIGLTFRTAVVAPRQSAVVRADAARERIAPLLESTSLPMLALPGFGPPAPGPLTADPPQLTASQIEVLSAVDEELSRTMRAAPTVAAVPAVLAPARLLLGDDREARLAWEAVLANGSGPQIGEARVGLGLVALRAAARASDDEDRRFALGEALEQLDRAIEEPSVVEAARFDRAVVLGLLGRPDDARVAAADLPPARRRSIEAWLASGLLVGSRDTAGEGRGPTGP